MQAVRSRLRPKRRTDHAGAPPFMDEKMPPMEIHTSRFGPVSIESNDVIHFPSGLLGLDGCRDWVLLADTQNDVLGWLQSTTQGEVALAVVSPRRFVPDYQVRVARTQLDPLGLNSLQDAHVLVIVSKNEQSITLNLKAPLIINLQRSLGRQVVDNAEYPIQFELCCELPSRKKIA
jgi:flagellar assembly factor FliW